MAPSHRQGTILGGPNLGLTDVWVTTSLSMHLLKDRVLGELSARLVTS